MGDSYLPLIPGIVLREVTTPPPTTMKNRQLVEQFKVSNVASKRTSIRVYKVGKRFRGVICILDGYKNPEQIIKVPGRFSSISVLRREAGLILEQMPANKNDTHYTPDECYVGFFEYFRQRRAENTYNFVEFFYLAGSRAVNWPHLMIEKRYRPGSALTTSSYDYEVEKDDEFED